MRRLFSLLCCALATLSSVDAAAGESRVITVDEAVAMAMAQNAALQAARARLEAGQAAASSTARRLAPAIHLGDEYQHYNSTFDAAISPVASFRVRGRDTNMFTVAADQPLLGLLRLSADYSGQQESAEAGAAQVESAELSLRQAVETLYLRVFEARALEGTALAPSASSTIAWTWRVRSWPRACSRKPTCYGCRWLRRTRANKRFKRTRRSWCRAPGCWPSWA